MTEFVDPEYAKSLEDKDFLKYELHAVLIHSGVANSGHYHVYIRDILNEGNFVLEEEEE